MAPERLEFPVAYCRTCDELGPVVIDEINDEGPIGELVVIYCPQCSNLLNINEDVKVEWYTKEEIAKVTGWKVVDESQ